MIWETVIGLEVHAELSTKSKIFCSCSSEFGGQANSHVCPVCSGMPGSLPKLNRLVVEYALLAGLALNCSISKISKFDRKNYFYPDLPKAYQISQLYSPICYDGHMNIEVDGESKTIGIREIHIEEDAGKLIHDLQSDSTRMDFNRCGVPLLEIVSNPDFRNGSEVLSYLEKLREILMYLGICDCKMQEGSLRADINLSVRPIGGELGTRVEMKNLNSFKAISRAIDFESARQIKVLQNGGEIVQETRRWDDDAGLSLSMRSKEDAKDYRYFPEPDLLPIIIDDAWLNKAKRAIPELAHQKRERYINEWGLSASEAAVLTVHIRISELFETLSSLTGEAIESARLICGEIMRLMNVTNTLPEDLSIDPEKLAVLIKYVIDEKINRNSYKEAVEAVYVHNADPEEYIGEKGLLMLDDISVYLELAKTVIKENPDAAFDFASGKDKAFGFLLGKLMSTLKGAGNPELARKALQQQL